MFFKYIEAKDVLKSLSLIEEQFYLHHKATSELIKSMKRRLEMYECQNSDFALIITEKVEELFKSGLPSELAMQKVARDTGTCLSTVQYVWGVSNKKYKAFQKQQSLVIFLKKSPPLLSVLIFSY